MELALANYQLEHLLAVDRDHRYPLQIRPVERGIGLDVALFELEFVVRPRSQQQLAGVIA
jgi:hypothetical protein